MASYCPYSNIERKAYPAVLSTGSLTDPRVTCGSRPSGWPNCVRTRQAPARCCSK
ncbi:MAG: hypothetical protein R3C16_02165 [Hyphomonadaceae bacterium]